MDLRQFNEDFIIGYDEFNRPILWNPNKYGMQNGNVQVVGAPGSGKTVFLKEILKYLHRNKFVVYVIDLHGDLFILGERLFTFNLRNSEWGVNPFEFEKNIENGGVKAHTEILFDIFKNFAPRSGDKQKGVWLSLIRDTYKMAGIYEDDPSTWNNPLPTIEDLYNLHQEILGTLKNGKYKNFKQLFSEIRKAKNKEEKQIEKICDASGQDKEEVEDSFENSLIICKFQEIEQKLERYKNFCIKGHHSDEFKNSYKGVDFDDYDTPEKISVLSSLEIYIEQLNNASFFRGIEPDLSFGVNRFDISGYTSSGDPTIAVMFAKILAQKVFRANKIEKNILCDYRKVHTYLVVDETKIVLPKGKEKENSFEIFNRVGTEARKFGLATINVSQRIEHFGKDLVSGMYTKMILRSDDSDIPEIKKRFGIKNDVMFKEISIHGKAILCSGQIKKVITLPKIEFLQEEDAVN